MNLRLAKYVLVTAVLLILLTDDTDAWRRRRCQWRDCRWGPWSAWGPCSAACGTSGTQTRARGHAVTVYCGGTPCSGPTSQTQACNRKCCPQNCVWYNWGSWSACTATCGSSGIKDRTRGRSCTIGCTGEAREVLPCNRRCCPENCVWYNWGSWSACTATCGSSGIRDRTRNTECQIRLMYTSRVGHVPSDALVRPARCYPVTGGAVLETASGKAGDPGALARHPVEATEGVPEQGTGHQNRVVAPRAVGPATIGTTYTVASGAVLETATGVLGGPGALVRQAVKAAEHRHEQGQSIQNTAGGGHAVAATQTRGPVWGDAVVETVAGVTGVLGAPAQLHVAIREPIQEHGKIIAVSASCGGSSCTGDASETNPCNRYCPHGSPNGPICNCAGTGYNGTCCDNDIDECSTGVHNCHQHATCNNTVGSYRCECNSGYAGNGRTCTALCLGSTTCPHGGICSSPNHCTSCDSGYESPDCGNINECAMDTDNCHANASCTDTDGSFTCTCSDGYTGSGLHCERKAPNLVSCPADTRITVNSPSGGILDWTDPEFRFQPSNELANHQCSADKGDAAPIGTHSVQCWAEGFADGTTCDFDVIIEDINECAEETDTCADEATCTNTIGSYTCDCDSGYGGDGNSCTDINECAEETDTCADEAACTNTPGSYTCACGPGYRGDGSSCTDINECAEGTDTCADEATCTNTPGSYTCACDPGYRGDGGSCTDINECDEGTDTCDDDATCTNTIGSYTCDCDSGYRGDGNSCTDIDECAEGTDTCDDDATCTNTPGGYTCDCVDGYTGDGFTCTDVNECEEGTHTCDEHATCTNTPGGHTCACKAGYNGDGFTCTGGCSSGFEFWNGACYYYSPGRRTFLSAESDCDRRGAKLVVVPDSATHQYLIQRANGKRLIWIGLSDRRRERAFVWSNGVPLAQSFHPWRGRNNVRSDCVSMMKSRRTYVWKVRGCGAKLNYFCQKNP
ncbi:FBN1 [Branchiostoma lanceolatum]|uniref:FBN1 protein n=1 Tax=Branchiostoma lanceolatum TaxID=7740 RepID=A0A8J9WCT8_BRALA|nr:FBN1 [Branchiostoma lanceolatum]